MTGRPGLVLKELALLVLLTGGSSGQGTAGPSGEVRDEIKAAGQGVAGTAEEAVVTGEAPPINTAGATISDLADVQKLSALPLNARGLESVTALQTGASVDCARTVCSSFNAGAQVLLSTSATGPRTDGFPSDARGSKEGSGQTRGAATETVIGAESASKFPGLTTSSTPFPPPIEEKRQILGLFLGQVELGGRVFLERPGKKERGKFQEYRGIRPGLFVEGLHFQLEGKGEKYSSEFRAGGTSEVDQNYLFRIAALGHYDARFEWDQIPHVFSNTGRSLYKQTRRGVLELDSSIQSSIQAAPTGPAAGSLLQGFLGGAHDIDLNSGWDIARFLAKQTPTPHWDLRYEYARTRKEGNRPIGALTGYGNELLEPIEQTIHDLRLTAGVARERGQLQFGYDVSLFKNGIDTLVWDEYLRLDDSATAGPSRGRHDLAPNNSAHTGSVTGALNLPWRSRFTGTFSYGLRFQNDPFIPHTINSAISDPGLALPAESLHGEVHARVINLQFTSRPVRDISVRARYRLYDFADRTPNLTFPAWVSTDFTLRTGARGTVISSRFSYTKHNAGADVGWRALASLAFKVGHEWERWDRDERQRAVPVSDEHTPKVSLEYTHSDWFLLRASYARSWRRISGYNTFAHLASGVTPTEFARLVPDGTSQSPLLRMFDQADRDRDRVDFLPQFTFLGTLTFTPTLSFGKDDYKNSFFGLQRHKSWAAGADVSWSPLEGVATIVASYMREQFFARQRSRYRPFLPDFRPRADNLTYDWVARNEDIVDTFRVGIDAPLVAGKLDLHLAWSYSQAIGKMRAFNPVPPSGGAAAWNADAQAVDFPDIKDSLHPLEASLRYRLSKGYFVKLGYVFEQFHISDFRTGNIQPYMGDVDPIVAQSAVYLGGQIRPYTAQILALTIGYRF